ncbi:GTPase domain-containing protein [Candidatus Magnetomorum sp. HK-1]|nr:GTPase domain-containing protein [Candidatus Magnetomorum sp. HK-1]KPA19113.1 GTPase domain-containing protein [Candidatus Magnetomorum sp. HK-1]
MKKENKTEENKVEKQTPDPAKTNASEKQEPVTVESETISETIVPSKEEIDEDKVIRNHVHTAVAISLLPTPLFDLVALTGVQINLVRKIAKKYNIPFMEDKVKNIISSLIGGSLPLAIAFPVISLVKAIPVLGQSLAVVSLPAIAGATTYAVGKVFIRHFSAGGTFLTLDPSKVKGYYQDMFKEGKLVAATV